MKDIYSSRVNWRNEDSRLSPKKIDRILEESILRFSKLRSRQKNVHQYSRGTETKRHRTPFSTFRSLPRYIDFQIRPTMDRLFSFGDQSSTRRLLLLLFNPPITVSLVISFSFVLSQRISMQSPFHRIIQSILQLDSQTIDRELVQLSFLFNRFDESSRMELKSHYCFVRIETIPYTSARN